MKNFLMISILLVSSLPLSAHEGGHGTPLKEWLLASSHTSFKADFIKYESSEVWLSDAEHRIIKFNLSDFSSEDQRYIIEMNEMILALNTKDANKESGTSLLASKWQFVLIGCALVALLLAYRKKRMNVAYGLLAAMLIVFASCSVEDLEDVLGGKDADDEPTSVSANDIADLEAAFGHFDNVTTSSDDTYFYVSSTGLPDHEMMVGITSWQQQVPIPQDYTGDNSWAFPLQPVLADTVLEASEHFMRGAMAIAVNGIPIFNPLNNRGEDALAIGELDQWGGHCGRADDYHYHVPPLHLQSTVGEDQPVAYALDGFPVYGETTDDLDECLGKFNEDGSYQYHTIDEAPYFIAAMRGEVTLDPSTTAPEDQIIPQAMTRGVRPFLPVLPGAEITAFTSTGTNAYSLEYQIESDPYYVNYGWNESGLYTYEFVDSEGNVTTETYQR